MRENDRVVCWFSCGATSAVAAKLAIQKYGHKDLYVVYCDTGSEHPSNADFLKSIEGWLRHPITILKSSQYADIWAVFEQTRFLVGPQGARCTAELKKALRLEFQRPYDIQVFGYHVGERERAAKFRANNPEVTLSTPLIEKGITDKDCLGILQLEGLPIPAMYLPQKSGAPYSHNNCIGCPKGGMGYWNKIRIDFPAVFERMAKVERTLGIAINKREGEGRSRIPVYLDELPPDAGDFAAEEAITCDLLCGMHLQGIRGRDA